MNSIEVLKLHSNVSVTRTYFPTEFRHFDETSIRYTLYKRVCVLLCVQHVLYMCMCVAPKPVRTRPDDFVYAPLSDPQKRKKLTDRQANKSDGRSAAVAEIIIGGVARVCVLRRSPPYQTRSMMRSFVGGFRFFIIFLP